MIRVCRTHVEIFQIGERDRLALLPILVHFLHCIEAAYRLGIDKGECCRLHREQFIVQFLHTQYFQLTETIEDVLGDAYTRPEALEPAPATLRGLQLFQPGQCSGDMIPAAVQIEKQ